MKDVIANGGALLILLGFCATIFLGGFFPVFVWSIARNTKKIRQQLERLNDTLEGRGAGGRPGALGL